MENAIKILQTKAAQLHTEFGVPCQVELQCTAGTSDSRPWYWVQIGETLARHRGSAASFDLETASNEAAEKYRSCDPVSKLTTEAAAAGYKLVKIEG